MLLQEAVKVVTETHHQLVLVDLEAAEEMVLREQLETHLQYHLHKVTVAVTLQDLEDLIIQEQEAVALETAEAMLQVHLHQAVRVVTEVQVQLQDHL